jgi:hypothetical protein
MTYGPATAPVDPVGRHVVATGGRFFGDDEHGMDQLWWNFAGGAPGCTAAYVAPPITDEQTGSVVEVAGSFFLRMRCSPVRALDLAREDREGQTPHTYDETVRYRRGSDADFPPARNMVEVVQTGWGDGVLTITVGLRRRVPFGIAWAGGSAPHATGPTDVQGAWLVVMQ